MSLSTEMLEYLDTLAKAIIGKAEHRLIRRIVTTFTDSDEEVPSSKLVKNEITTIRSEMPTKTSDLTNDGENGTNKFLSEVHTQNIVDKNITQAKLTDSLSNYIDGKIDKKATNILENDNLNDYKTPGFYYSYDNNRTSTLSNLPNGFTGGFSLFVYGSRMASNVENAVHQLLSAYNKDNQKIFIRTYSSSNQSWGEWIELINSNSTILNSKVDKITGKGLSTEDFTTALKSKLENDVLTQHQDISMKADKSEIPTKTSDLTNDSGFLTQHQDISGKEDKTNKLTSLNGITPTNDHYPSVMLVIQMLTGLENTLEKISNKVTSLSSSSTNTQYPSAKAVYDAIPSETITLTATLEDETTKTYIVYGEEKIININSSNTGGDELQGADIQQDP